MGYSFKHGGCCKLCLSEEVKVTLKELCLNVGFNLYFLDCWTHDYIFIYFLGYVKFPFESFVHFCVFPYFLIEPLGVFHFLKLFMNKLTLCSQNFQFFLHRVVLLVEFFSDLVSFLQSQCWMYQLCPVDGTHSNVSPWAYKDRLEPLYLWWVFIFSGKHILAFWAIVWLAHRMLFLASVPWWMLPFT